MCKYIHIYIYMCVYIYMYIYTSMCVCIYVYIGLTRPSPYRRTIRSRAAPGRLPAAAALALAPRTRPAAVRHSHWRRDRRNT